MNITSHYTPSTFSFASSSRHNMSPLNTKAPLAVQDRDVQVQRALLGESAYLEDTDSPCSPLNTPSPTLDGMSPLSAASHLQDACDAFQIQDVNPFLDASWKTRTLNEADHEPVRLVGNNSKSSPKRQNWSVPVTPEPSSATLLPTIQEVAPQPPVLPPRRRQTTMNTTHTYALPQIALGSSSTSSQMRRRPSPFPLGPVPPPPPQRRARYEPRPHIVDLATEQFGLKTPTISTTAATTQLQQERERQWQLWESERIRSLEMTKEAAKNNRVQTPSRNARPAVVVQEKPAPTPAPAPAPVKKAKRSWWCFGGAVESDAEEINEKAAVRSASRLSSISSVASEEDEDDSDEWDEARTANGATTGLLGFACSSRRKAGPTRQRATLKKRAV